MYKGKFDICLEKFNALWKFLIEIIVKFEKYNKYIYCILLKKL